MNLQELLQKLYDQTECGNCDLSRKAHEFHDLTCNCTGADSLDHPCDSFMEPAERKARDLARAA